jgi:hypothetical protein
MADRVGRRIAGWDGLRRSECVATRVRRRLLLRYLPDAIANGAAEMLLGDARGRRVVSGSGADGTHARPQFARRIHCDAFVFIRFFHDHAQDFRARARFCFAFDRSPLFAPDLILYPQPI